MTRYLIDTNVLSELVGTAPDPAVLGFVGTRAPADLFLSAISRFEIDRGLGMMPEGRRRDLYAERYRTLVDGLGGVLPLDDAAAGAGARIALAARARGTSLDDHLLDALIAGTALASGLTVLTRNERQFRATGVAFENPWSA